MGLSSGICKRLIDSKKMLNASAVAGYCYVRDIYGLKIKEELNGYRRTGNGRFL